MRTHIPKVVPLKAPIHILLIWPLDSLRDPSKGTPKPEGTTLKVQGGTLRFLSPLSS